MSRTSTLLRFALLALLLPVVATAQETPAKPPAHTYRLTYTLTVNDAGKKVSVQHFTMTVSPPSNRGSVKMGEKVPVATGSYSVEGKTSIQTQFTYLDVGLNISATVVEEANGVQLSSKLEQSSIAPGPVGFPQDPIVRQIVLDNTTILYPGKPVTLGSLDIPDSTRHTDIEVVMERLP
jgi:hypothetical protein